jgi:hypothetical protein
MKKTLCVILLILGGSSCMELLAQHLRHSIGFEVGGAGLAYSLNYENMSANGFTKRIGLALETQGFAVPFQLGKMFGNEKHHFEVAGGLTYWYDPLIYKDTRIHRHRCVASAFAGYRYQKPASNFYFRAVVGPIVGVYDSERRDGFIFPWAGLGVGGRF